MRVKKNNYRYRNGWLINNFRDNNLKKKQRVDTKNEAKKIKSDNCTRAIEKSQYCGSKK